MKNLFLVLYRATYVSFTFSERYSHFFHWFIYDYQYTKFIFMMNGNFVQKQYVCACNIFKNSILRECLSSSIWYIEKLCVYNIFQQEENLAWFGKQNRYSGRCCIKGSSRNLHHTWASAKLIIDIIGKSVMCGMSHFEHEQSDGKID